MNDLVFVWEQQFSLGSPITEEEELRLIWFFISVFGLGHGVALSSFCKHNATTQ